MISLVSFRTIPIFIPVAWWLIVNLTIRDFSKGEQTLQLYMKFLMGH